MKKYFLAFLILNCTFLIGEASAQWWVQGGNLLWPYGTVTVKDSFSVGKNTLLKNNLRVYNDAQVDNSLTVSSIEGTTQITSPYINATDGYFENVTVSGTLTATIESTDSPQMYVALLSQELTSDPEAYVLENTIGFDITWTRSSAGRYTGTFSLSVLDARNLFIIAPTVNYSNVDFGFDPISFTVSNSAIQIRQDQEDIPGWIGATINYDGVKYYPIKIIRY